MHRSRSRLLHLASIFALIFSFIPRLIANAEAVPKSSNLLPAAPFIRADGSFAIPETFNGAINIAGWNISLDANKGPIFAPPQLNSAEWTELGSNGSGDGAIGNNSVNALAVIGGDLYVGGNFTNVSNNGISLTAADFIAKWDGTNWSALGSNGAGNGSLGNSVNALAVIGTELYVGGSFQNVNNNGTSLASADRIVRWDGSNWSALGSNGQATPNGSIGSGQVNALEVIGNDLYVGGSFTDVNNNGTLLRAGDRIAKWDGTNWSALGNNGGSTINGSIGGSSTIAVTALQAIGSDLYVGGNFQDVNNYGSTLSAADRIAKWDGTNWSALGNNGSGNGSIANGQVFALEAIGSDLYVGGSFTNLNNNGAGLGAADRIAKWDGVNWSALGSNGSGDGSIGSGQVSALLAIATDLFVGGSFQNVNNNGVTLLEGDFIAKWDGIDWSTLGNNGAGTPNGSLNGNVNTLSTLNGDLYVGGAFQNVNNNGTQLNNADRIAYVGISDAPVAAFSGAPVPGSTLAFSGLSGTAPSLELEVSNNGEAGSELSVSLDSVSAGYSIAGGLPIASMLTTDPAATISVECDSVPQADGTLTLSTNDPVAPTVTYNLTCNAQDPAYTSIPPFGSTLAFSGITGSNPSLTIEVSNTGDPGSSLDVSLDSISSGYSINSGLPFSGLQPTDSSVTITVECDAVPQANGTLTLATNDPVSPGVDYDLICVSVDPLFGSTPSLGSMLTFRGSTGTVPIGEDIDISNVGDAGSSLDVTLDSISSGYNVEGLPISGLQTNNPPVTISVECDVIPQADGTLTLSTNDAANSIVSYDLHCLSVDPAFSSNPSAGATLAFSGITGTTPLSQIIEVNNAGDAGSSLNVSLDSISSGYSVITGLPINGLQTTDSSVSIEVECDQVAQPDGILTLSTSDLDNISVSFDLTCAAADPGYASSPAPGSTLSFNGITGTTPPNQTIDITNIGDTGSGLDVVLGSISSGFSLVSGLPINGLQTSDPASSIIVKCDTVPQADGTLTLSTNDPFNAIVSYGLTCSAADPGFSGNPAPGSILAFSGITGSNPSLTIEVSNIGDAGSGLAVSLDTIGTGYSISGLPISGLQTTDPAATITVECDSVPQVSATLTLTTNDPANSSVSYDLTCGVEDPAFSSNPAPSTELAMAGLLGANPAYTVEVTNTGDPGSTLQVDLNSISAGYSIASGLPVAGLGAGDPAALFTVKCDSAPQPDGTLELITNDPNSPVVSYPLSCSMQTESGDTVEREKVESQEIDSAGTTTLSFGRIFVSLPASAIPPGQMNCKIVIANLGDSGEYGFTLSDLVYDIKVVCDSGPLQILFSPLTVCIRPRDGDASNKHVFHRHAGAANFTILADGAGLGGYVCGTTQILSLFTLSELRLPDTGFTPDFEPALPEQPLEKAYLSADLLLEIPSLGVRLPIAGVPMLNGEWDVTWLGQSAGYLYGTAFPTWVGNSVLTAHVWNADNTAGPFHRLRELGYGEQFTIHAFGSAYVYEVRSNRRVSDQNLGVISESEVSLVTLLTCESFNENTSQYTYRRAVQAVLVDIR